MKTIATKNTATETETMFSKTDAEYAEIDKALAETRKLFASLKDLEALGQYGTEVWKETFAKYAVVFKEANGYRPLWAR